VIVEIITAFVGGGGFAAAGAIALRWREQSRALAKDDATAIATREELERKALADIIGRYKSELDALGARHKLELGEQAQRHKRAIDESAEKLREAMQRGDAAELESERERSRRREAERERDEAKAREAEERLRRFEAERERDAATASVSELSDRVGEAMRKIEELNRRSASDEHPAVK